ncbi:hypothetical protein [Streptomyces sp. Z26]|uniref:hypothetical protein n=1 Tax=Streptomyces sp. Z26 TaxID=2500177 RepID=UPI000EF16D19|nr:hypothetical protein [Streptomyces sp. Z26]RLL66980.1 hypothetical protein D7M15_08985 [Streptomyces sp. Z26]
MTNQPIPSRDAIRRQAATVRAAQRRVDDLLAAALTLTGRAVRRAAHARRDDYALTPDPEQEQPMHNPTPAAEIRAAAETLRALATAASTATSTPLARGGQPTTRWHFAEHVSGSGYLYAENPSGRGVRLLRTLGAGGRGHRDPASIRTRHGAYAAAMDPVVGLALAAALDEAAASIEQGAMAEALLDVARAINRSQP